ncbi:hypothetical protein [Microseira wollei]|uniref:hypothetical protein n=1 Tax=Microseira wollei TaxID=467598 RepID=UPI001CFF2DF5|nr:hypothetical protein [Microseira wollei]
MINICLGQNIPAAVPLLVNHPNPVGARHVSNWDWCKISLLPCPYWCITQTRLGHGMIAALPLLIGVYVVHKVKFWLQPEF